MFEEKATAEQLNNLAGRMGSENRRLQNQISDIEAEQIEINHRLNRYDLRLSKIMRDLENFQTVVDHNAQQGENANGAIREVFERSEELKSAVELLASEMGTKIEVLPEIQAVVTIQPGLPERLGLTKLTKAQRKLTQENAERLPSPIQLTADDTHSDFFLD